MAIFFSGERMIGSAPLSLLPKEEQRIILPELDSVELSGRLSGKADAIHGKECNPPSVHSNANMNLGLAETIAYIDEYFSVKYPEDKNPQK